MHTPTDFAEAAAQIIDAGAFLAAHQWAPATAGNYSVRLPDGRMAITVSGQDKGALTPDSVMLIDADGKPLSAKKPSAETALHVALYKAYSGCNAVLHTHSLASTVLTRHFRAMKSLVLTDYEFLKLFPGITTHTASMEIPIVENDQDMQILQGQLAGRLLPQMRAYLIRGHGLYVWSENMALTRRLTEAVEFMLACELELNTRGAMK